MLDRGDSATARKAPEADWPRTPGRGRGNAVSGGPRSCNSPATCHPTSARATARKTMAVMRLTAKPARMGSAGAWEGNGGEILVKLAVFTSKYPARVATFFERDMRS